MKPNKYIFTNVKMNNQFQHSSIMFSMNSKIFKDILTKNYLQDVLTSNVDRHSAFPTYRSPYTYQLESPKENALYKVKML